MSEHLDLGKLDDSGLRKVRSVEEFCRRYRLNQEEHVRLTRLFGHFASEQELLMNARRPPVFR
ncbi:hypothetical protein BJF93_04070 [Xaviernesmea oryzae]|uniref:Uncharacterized protein n=1 Tax=Xaviernesmea oryzae TaxID=464029 RepID=A0A1Q9AUJ2_9HYPH|nr:hypothetical protein [Xaviernesmea oryzae]OLP59103.1 hypothetical protein BJF93_04070 [Xaviernesmea oryzae]SEK86500.1 hypothetical protein SAMN04487976_104228 [Xaviernesmea oryzae]